MSRRKFVIKRTSVPMSVNSILTNASALSALQSLNMTEQNLSITQNQVSTGLAVASASQNSAYWSVAQQLNSDSGIVTAANSALSQSQAIFDVATSATDVPPIRNLNFRCFCLYINWLFD